MADDIQPGDIVAVNYGHMGRREGIVIGSRWDYAGRQIVEVQMDPGEIFHAWYPTVTRVKRVISISGKPRTIERRVYW